MVFTQHDELVDPKELNIVGIPGLGEEQLKCKAEENAKKAFDLLCVGSLRKSCKQINREKLPPVINVSARPGYGNTPLDLVHLSKNIMANVVRQIGISQATMSSRKGVSALTQQRNRLDNLVRASSGRQYECRSNNRKEVLEVLGSELPLSEQSF